jgi:hypothetical protein
MTKSSGAVASPTSSSEQQQQPAARKNQHTPISSFIAGIAGGTVSTILLYPLDLIKVRMQVDESPSRNIMQQQTMQSTIVAKEEIKRRRTICTTVKGVIRHEGYLGLYRGLSPAIIGSAASYGGFFFLYEDIKGRMVVRKQHQFMMDRITTTMSLSNQNNNNNQNESSSTTNATFDEVKLGPMEHFSASCLAGACMVALTNPLWLIKTRLQLQNSRLQSQLTQTTATAATTTTTSAAVATTAQQMQTVKPPYRGAFHAAFVIIQEEGILALYKGSVPALMLVSHGGIQFMTYEFMKKHFALYVNTTDKISKEEGESSSNKNSRKGTTIGERLRDSLGYLTMGAISKFVASTATYPLQVIKSRLQQRSQSVEVSEITGEIVVMKREYSGLVDCTTKIWKNEGIYGFFKGCITNALRVAPSAAVTFVTYEFVMDMLTE